MKRILCFTFALAMLLLFAGCGPKESAETVVKNALESVKSMDVEAMQGYWGSDQFKDISSDEADAEADAESLAMTGMIVKNLDYQVIKVDEGEDTATVTVQLTNYDMSSIMSEFVSDAFKQVLAYAFLPADQQPSAEELDAKYTELMTTLLTRADNPTVTSTVDISLSLVDKKWVITPNEDAVDAMLGGISSFSEAMAEASSEDGSSAEASEKDQITEIRNWAVTDIWNAGFCDLTHYYYDGKGSTGQTLDAAFAIQQLDTAMEKKSEYDTYMSALPSDYADIAGLWAKVSEQIALLYADVQGRGLSISGQQLDTALYSQYFTAFDTALSELS